MVKVLAHSSVSPSEVSIVKSLLLVFPSARGAYPQGSGVLGAFVKTGLEVVLYLAILFATAIAAAEPASLENARAAIQDANELYAAEVTATNATLSNGAIDEEEADDLRDRLRDAETELSLAEAEFEIGDYEDAVKSALRARQALGGN
jgi:hypothetical protein